MEESNSEEIGKYEWMPEIEADHSLDHTLHPDYNRKWTGQQLLVHYLTREVTEEQMKGMIEYEKELYKVMPEGQKKRLFESGIQVNDIPADFMSRVEKLYPELKGWNQADFLKRLNKKMEKVRNYDDKKYVFTFKGAYLMVDGGLTPVTYVQISNLFKALAAFMEHKDLEKQVVKYVAKRIKKYLANSL